MPDNWVSCPVERCEYSGEVASVAGHVSGKKDAQHDWQRLGYDGANHFKKVRRQMRSQQERTRVLHIADTHIGKHSGGYGREHWSVDCARGFTRAIDAALSLDVDAVFHTGDLFHNDRHGITHAEAVQCGLELSRLNEAGIPFYYILGDHEREEGTRWLQRYEESGFATHLSNEPALIGRHLALYGNDYEDQDWWENSRWDPERPPANRRSILALHQSLAPLSNQDHAQCDVEEIQSRTRKSSGFQFNVIALGQLHKKIDRPIGGCRVICGGATERLGQKKDSFAPFVGVFEAQETTEICYRTHPIA